ncbi:MAG: OmpA family protein [Holophagales bacterium]|jgi:outer membrane protein OmpA-like peptidoglycan-associated protein|nr:OmpA family protein [Holophagales bacterium]
MKNIILLLPLIFLAACQKPVPLEPDSMVDDSISATVHTLPPSEGVIYKGKMVGQAPVTLKVSSLDQLANNLSTTNSPDGTVEQRIRHLADDKVVVTLVLDKNLSKMATALNLKKILVFDYGDEITFEFNKSDLKPVFKTLLVRQADLLKKHFNGIDIYVCGHSDSVGRPERNLELSMDRAKSVFDVLLDAGIPKGSMKVQGFGSDYPLDDNDTEAGRARNRRIEIILGR